jgi:hypothetical protein
MEPKTQQQPTELQKNMSILVNILTGAFKDKIDGKLVAIVKESSIEVMLESDYEEKLKPVKQNKNIL